MCRWWCRPTGVVVAFVVLIGGVPSAFGSAPWSDPQTLAGAYVVHWESVSGAPPGQPGLNVPLGYRLTGVPGLLGFTPGGAGVAVLGREDGGQGFTRFSAAQGRFGPLRASAFAGIAPSRMALFGREGVILAGQANRPGDPRFSTNPEILLDAAVTRGTLSGGFSQRQVLGTGMAGGSGTGLGQAIVTALAANSAGDAAAVVSVPVAAKRKGLIAGYQSRLFVRRRGQPSFRRIADIGGRRVGHNPAALAVNAPGDVLVAWDERYSVRARLVRASGELGAEQRLGPGGSAYTQGERLVAAMDGTRRMLVAWMAQPVRLREGEPGRPGIVAVAYASPYQPFRAAQVVQSDLPTREWGNAVRVALLRNRGVVVWTGWTGGRYAVRTVDVAQGRASAPRDLSPAGVSAQLRGLAVGPRGGTVVAWASGAVRKIALPKPPLTLQAMARSADVTAWGPVENVAITDTGAQDFMASDALVTADPVSGQAVLLFSDPLPPGANSLPPSPVPVRYSVRPPR